jgi:hypothetical protein
MTVLVTGLPGEADVFGRTVVGRAAPDAAGRVFLFTHETLREEAVGRLGTGTLAAFTTRLRYPWEASHAAWSMLLGGRAHTSAVLIGGRRITDSPEARTEMADLSAHLVSLDGPPSPMRERAYHQRSTSSTATLAI